MLDFSKLSVQCSTVEVDMELGAACIISMCHGKSQL